MKDLETEIREYVPTLFSEDKRLSGSIFWRRMGEYAKRSGEIEVTGEIYETVTKMFKEGIIGLDDGVYYLRSSK